MVKNAKLMRWCSIVVEEEGGPSISAVMVKNKAFCDWAEASVHCEETKKWFERIIVGETEADEMWFDSLCQRINERLAKMLLLAVKKGNHSSMKSSKCSKPKRWMVCWKEM